MPSNYPVPLESQEGDALVAYLRIRDIVFTHVGNESGSGRHDAMLRGAKMKRQGTSKGFPDYVIALPGVGVLFIELKRQKGGTVSPEQKAWIEVLNACPGVEARICRGADESIRFIEELYPPEKRQQVGRLF